MSGLVYARADAARDFAVALLTRARLSPKTMPRIAAHCLIRADLRGVETHGMLRLPIYLDRIRRGLVQVHPPLRPRRVMPAASHLDGGNGLGFVVGTRAMNEALEIARTQGIGWVAVNHSTHFGMAANYILQAAEAGYAGLAITNASPAMPPWGGRAALLGTGPMAAGVPGGEGCGFRVRHVTHGGGTRQRSAWRSSAAKPFPKAMRWTPMGEPTTDPAKALAGIMLPLGGAKGSGIAIMMDVFAGVLSGAAFGGDVRDQNKDFENPQNVGHFFVALKPDIFVSRDELKARMHTLTSRVRGAAPADGFKEVLMPGDPEARLEKARLTSGIPYGVNEVDDVQKEAARAGLPPLAVSERPYA